MKKLFKINQHEYLKTDRQGNICLRTTDANKLNKNKFISTFQNKLYRFFKNLCTRSTLKVHLFFKASSCETNFVSGNKLFKNSLAKILLGKNQKNKLIFWYWYETLPCRTFRKSGKWHQSVFSNKISKSCPICMKFISEIKNISSNEIQIDFWWKNYFFRKYLKSHFWALLG